MSFIVLSYKLRPQNDSFLISVKNLKKSAVQGVSQTRDVMWWSNCKGKFCPGTDHGGPEGVGI